MTALRTIVRDDLGRCLRSRLAVVAMVLFVALASWLPWMGSHHAQADDRPLLLALRQIVLWVPFFAIVLGVAASDRHASVDSDRTPRATVVGTLLGRLALLVVGCSVVVAALAGLIRLDIGTVNPTSVVGGLLALVLFGAAWLGLTVGLSMIVETVTRTVALATGCVVLIGLLWHETAVAAVSLVLTGRTEPAIEQPVLLVTLEEPTWYLYVARVSPFDAVEAGIYFVLRALETLLGGSTAAPLLPNLFGLDMLVLWAVGPVCIGYWWHDRS